MLRSFSYQNVSQIVNKIFAVHCFFANHLKHTTVNKNNLQSALSKSLPTICTLSEQLSNRYNYFLRLTVFPDLFVKVFLINFNFFNLLFLTICRDQVYSNIRMQTQGNTSQRKTKRINTCTTRDSTCPTRVNTSQYKFHKSSHESARVQNRSRL